MLEEQKPSWITQEQQQLLIGDIIARYPESSGHVVVATKDRHSCVVSFKEDNQKLIAKIYSGGSQRFKVMNEIEAVKIANEQSIPTPQVYQFETTFGRLAMIASRAVGNCTEVTNAQTYQIDTILAIIQKLHTLRKPKFGFAVEDRTITPALPESQVAYVGDIYSYCIGKLGLSHSTCRFDELMFDCQSNSEFVFSHRDLKPQHVFLTAGRLSSVIDWEQAVFIDPIIDYSVVHAHLLANGREDLANMVGAKAVSLFDMNRYRLHIGRELILIAAFVSENKTEIQGIVNIAQEYFSLSKNIGGLLVR